MELEGLHKPSPKFDDLRQWFNQRQASHQDVEGFIPGRDKSSTLIVARVGADVEALREDIQKSVSGNPLFHISTELPF